MILISAVFFLAAILSRSIYSSITERLDIRNEKETCA